MSRTPSLRSRLVWLVVAAVGASTAVATTVSVWQQVSSYSAMRRQALVATAQVFAAAAGRATAQRNADAAFQSLRAIGRMSDIQRAEIRARDGNVLASAGASAHLIDDLSIAPGEDVSVWDLLSSGTLQVKVPVMNAGEQVGELIVFGGIADLWSKLVYTTLLTLAGGAFALLAGVLVAMRLQRKITGPIHGLVDAMAAVRRTHRYDLSVEAAPDREIGELVAGFNQMLRDVRERDERLEAHRQNLEQEVADRTRELKDARDAAESANRAKSEFLATMSHEIRTPMNGIMVMADILNGCALPPRQQRYAEIIARSGRGLLSIINDILDFSKIEAGKLALEDIDVDLNEVAENVVGLFAEQARAKGVDLAAYVDPALPRLVRGDPVRLTQVATNLLNNALKFTREGAIKLGITFAADDPGRFEISVSDSGVGISPDKLDTIFDSFSQVDQSTTRQFGGTGLGLTICRRLAMAMGGDIRVASRVGEGSTFSMVVPCRATAESRWPRFGAGEGELPCCLIDVTGAATAETLAALFRASGFRIVNSDDVGDVKVVCAEPSRIGFHAGRARRPILLALSHPDQEGQADVGEADVTISKPVARSDIEALLTRIVRGEKVARSSAPARAEPSSRPTPFLPFKALVADDNVINREVAQVALSGLGAIVTLAEDGLQAIAAMRSQRFDVVFMDGSMPGMDGLTAASHIRRRETEAATARTPIVGLTAHVVGLEVQQWHAAGIDRVLYKPFTVSELARTVESLLPHLTRRDADAVSAEDVAPPVPAQDRRRDGDALIDEKAFAQLAVMRHADGNDFAQRIIGLYCDNAPLALAQIEEAARAGDVDGCARAAHALASMSSNIGASRVTRLAHETETLAREKVELPGSAVRAAMRQAFSDTIRAMRSRVPAGDRQAGPEPPKPAAVSPAPDAALERALERGFERGEFSLLYQPIVDRTGQRTTAVEALLRWRPQSADPVPPNVFIPVAERTGLIHDLGNWVMRRALDDCRGWDGIDISINVSAVQLLREDFAARTERAIAQSGIAAGRVVLEITESTLLAAENPAYAPMQDLCARGCRFALDDFGTGYASLTSLRRYPFERIKIDQSFVANLHTTADAAIVHAAVAIAKSLALEVVAEGIERPDQHKFLACAGVNFMQGYYFGRPMSKDDMSARIGSEREALRKVGY